MATSGVSARASRTARAIACLLCFEAAAHAAEPAPSPERVRARALYTQGEKLLKAGDLEAAQHAFEQAYQTMPNAVVLLKIAECQEKENDLQGAVTTLEKYLSERSNAPDRASIEGRIAEMRNKPGTVTVKSTPAGAAIWVDGRDSALVTPSDVELTPGEHTIALKLFPYQDAEQSTIVEFAKKTTLELTLAQPPPPPSRPSEGLPNSTAEPELDHGNARHLYAPFWIAVGVTAAGAAATTVFGVIALNKHSQFERTPTNQLADDGERAALISDISLGVAAAGAVTATVLFFTAPRGPRQSSGFTIVPMAGSHGGGLIGNARF